MRTRNGYRHFANSIQACGGILRRHVGFLLPDCKIAPIPGMRTDLPVETRSGNTSNLLRQPPDRHRAETRRSVVHSRTKYRPQAGLCDSLVCPPCPELPADRECAQRLPLPPACSTQSTLQQGWYTNLSRRDFGAASESLEVCEPGLRHRRAPVRRADWSRLRREQQHSEVRRAAHVRAIGSNVAADSPAARREP